MQVLGDFRLRDILCHDRSMTELRDMIRDMSTENFRIFKGFEYWAKFYHPL